MEEIKVTVKQYNSIYQELFEKFGIEVMNYMFKQYRGLSLSFPIRLINPEWQKYQVKADYDKGFTVKELAKKYEYTEHRIRLMLSSLREKEDM